MRIINIIKKNNSQMFTYLPATEVLPHDRFLEHTLLRLFPSSVTPNKLTALRIFLTPIVFLLTLYGHYRTGFFLFIVAATTDALDGSMARTQNKITRFGMLFDPLADKLLIGSMVLILVFRYFNNLLGIAILGLEIIIITSALVAKIKFKSEIMANRWGKIKMLLQVVAMSLTMLALLVDFPLLLSIAFWLFGLAIGFAILSLFKKGI